MKKTKKLMKNFSSLKAAQKKIAKNMKKTSQNMAKAEKTFLEIAKL